MMGITWITKPEKQQWTSKIQNRCVLKDVDILVHFIYFYMIPGMSFYEHAIYRVPFESFSPVSPPEFCDEPLDVMHRGMSNRPAESESKRLTCIGQLFQHNTKKMFHLLGALKKMLTTQSGIPSGTLQGFMTGNSCMGCGLSPWKSLVSYIISPPENCDLLIHSQLLLAGCVFAMVFHWLYCFEWKQL